MDKRNFRKKIFELKLVKSTRKRQKGGRQRPALLYEFARAGAKEIERFLW